MASQVQVKGLRELQQKMRGLPAKIRDRALLDSLFTAGAPMRDAARALAPKDTGRLAQNIVLARGRATGFEHDAEVVLKVRASGKRDDPKNAFYWLFVELGHFVRGITPHRGAEREKLRAAGLKFVPAQPFLRPAFEMHKEPTVHRFGVALWARIEKLLGRYAPTTIKPRR